MKKRNNLHKGIIFALLTAIISGLAIFYAKISLTKINPLILTTSRNFYVGGLFLTLILLTGNLNRLRHIQKNDLFKLIFIGIIGGGLPFYLFFTGLSLTDAQTANLIHKSLFIWVTIFGYFFLKERFNIWYLTSFLLVVFGTYFFAPLQLVFGRGQIMIFIATLLWSVENIIAKKTLKNISPDVVGLFRMGMGSLFLLASVIFSGKSHMMMTLNVNQLAIIAVGGAILFGYVYCWYRALKYAPVNLVTLILTFSLVIGNVLSSVLAGVKILPKDIYTSLFISLATLLIIISTYFKTKIQSLFYE